MAIGSKLKKLFEQTVEKPGEYKSSVKKLLGITDEGKDKAFDAKEVSFQEVAHEFLGSNYGEEVKRASLYNIMEAEGATVLPSAFSHISAFSDTISGLVDALTMEAYNSPEFIGPSLIPHVQTRMNGGKLINVTNDGNFGTNLNDGEAFPNVALGETYVQKPYNVRSGLVIQILQQDYIYDRTDRIQSAAQAAGYAVGRNKEIRIADCVQGKTNTYSRDALTSNTYRTAVLATAAYNLTTPMSFVNALANDLVDYTDINNAIQLLEANTDPATGFEITVSTPDAAMIVAPHRLMTARSIVKATQTQTRTATSTELRWYPNPLEADYKILASRIWYNRMLLAGTNAAIGTGGAVDATTLWGNESNHAQSAWWFGRFSKAFQYLQLIPFETVTAPLSSEDVRRDITNIFVTREQGVPFIVEPRYVGMFYDTASA